MSRDIANDAQHDVSRIQEQLLDMLRSAGKEAPPPRRAQPESVVATLPDPSASSVAVATKPVPAKLTGAPPAPGEDCPKCGSDTPWGRSNWCPECGYYPKAGFEGTGIVEQDEEAAPDLLSVFPEWVAPTLVAAAGVFVSSLVTRFVFHDPLQCSLVAVTQLLVFSALAFGAHFRASFMAVKTGRSWMAIVNPGETWSLVLSNMPATKSLIVLLGCSLAGIGSSFLIGLDVDLIAEEVAKEVKDNPKVTFSDIVGAMTKMTSKAFGNSKKNVAMAAFGQLLQATGQMSGGGGEGLEAGMDGENLEGAIGSLAGTAGMITDGMGGGGGGGGGDGGGLKSAIGGFGGTASMITEGMSSGGKSSGGQSGGSSSGSSGGSKTSPSFIPSFHSTGPGSSDGKSTEGEGQTSKTTGKDNSPNESPSAQPVASKAKGTMDYWIYGYTTNPDGEPRSLLLASTGGSGPLRFSQKLGLDGLSTEDLNKISEQLKPYRTRSAAVSSPYGGKWVKPVAKCRVEHEGLNADERPLNPKFQKVILP